jgi:alkanesulfonate monooxygenase SsuD/methylene tetrahydromethanopterin reductase-like flavin-dependent oxidoreductase (luciferase family)
VRLGLHVGYWGLGLAAAEQLELAREAEQLGYDSIWTAEAYGSDAVTVLAWLAAQTDRIRLGSAILQMPGRSPAMTAMTAATLDQLSGGRVLLGIGPSGPQVAEGWHGQPASCSARASTSTSCAWRCGASGSSTTARRSSCRCPTARARRSS